MELHNTASLAATVEEPRVVRLATVSSTQDVARTLPIGSVVVADHQTAGRGRLDRAWETQPGGALIVSFVLQPHPLMSLAAGVAAAEACGPDVRLKWPNDLVAGGRKAGGILVEMTATKAVVGVGINLRWAPEGAATVDRDRDELLALLTDRMVSWSRAGAAEVLQRWRELADTLGRHVRVELPGRTIEGIATDIAEDGALVVAGERVSAGDVIHLRPVS